MQITNFRDIATANPKINKGRIFRTSTLTEYQHFAAFEALCQKHNIIQIIDLRAEREVNASPYTIENRRLFSYVHAPFDPWNQSEAFQNRNIKGTNAEIAYHFFMLECQDSIQKVMLSLLNVEGATAIHCHAGKDRTGIIAIILQMLAGTTRAQILADYLASKLDTSESLFHIVWEEIKAKGGVEAYLQTCGLSIHQIQSLTKKLLWMT